MFGTSWPPPGLVRTVFALPRWLFRVRLGWLLGHRMLLLTHRGRRSGRQYTTAVEVAAYDDLARASALRAVAFRPVGEADA